MGQSIEIAEDGLVFRPDTRLVRMTKGGRLDLDADREREVPIPSGYGVTVFNPATSKNVFFDDCFRYAGDLVDGDMHVGDLVEAKGLRTEYLYSHPEWAPTLEDDVDQAEKELQAADARGVGLKWYYAEQGAADIARKRFADEGLGRIVIGYMPPRKSR